MTAITVSLREVVQELEALLEDAILYLDLETGELYQLGDDEPLPWRAGQEDDLSEWLEDDLPRIREIVANERRWLALPTRFDIHEWAIMDEYARGQEDADLSEELSRAIHGRGAFRVFKDAVYRRGIQEDWYASAARRSQTMRPTGSTFTAWPTCGTSTQRSAPAVAPKDRVEG